MHDIVKLRQSLRRILLNCRAISRIINTEEFEWLWNESNEEQQEVVICLVDMVEINQLKTWIKKHPSLDIGEKSLNQLKAKAKEFKIKGYTKLSKAELISIIFKRSIAHDKGGDA